jgi:hypothetical protein
VLRPSSLPRALAVATAPVLGVLGGVLGPALVTPTLAGPLVPEASAHAATVSPADRSQPLVPHIRSITPDYIPDHGPVVIRGTLTNASSDEWTAINVEGFVGATPITTEAGLAQAARTPVTSDVGHRIFTPGTFDQVATLEPGQTVHFKVRLPRSEIPVQAPGVYWFGVHALGGTAQGRSDNAAGRDRTFLPLIPKAAVGSGPPIDTALVVPVRAAVTRSPDGSVQDAPSWMSDLASGDLASVIDLGRAAQGRPLTWLVDPAVPDAVRALAHGNPPRTLATPGGSTSGGPSTSPSPSAAPQTSSSGTGTASDTAAGSSTTRVATRWLHQLHRQLAGATGETLGLPYGDLDVTAAARYDHPYLRAVLDRTGRTLHPWRLPLAGTVVAPPTGRISGSVVAALPRRTRVLLDDRAVRGSAPVVDDVLGRRLVLASAGAAEGGPGPVNPLSPLALRQRILSEAALRFLGSRAPLVVQLPTDWHGRAPASFFTGLDLPWLHLTTLDDATFGTAKPLDPARLRTPVTTTPAPGPELFSAVNRALSDAATLQSVLPGNRVLRRQVFDETTGNTSYAAAAEPFGALARVRSTIGFLAAGLGGVTLVAPPSVTLTSTSGRFSVQVSNDLDVPVSVKVRALADPRLRITGGESVPLPPHGRTSVLLHASTHELGVHTVTLEVTNQAGVRLGSSDSFPMRAEQVSRLIWVIIGAGLALLFGAIIVRLVRRVARSRA